MTLIDAIKKYTRIHRPSKHADFYFYLMDDANGETVITDSRSPRQPCFMSYASLVAEDWVEYIELAPPKPVSNVVSFEKYR